jgi:hypothetical protein
VGGIRNSKVNIKSLMRYSSGASSGICNKGCGGDRERIMKGFVHGYEREGESRIRSVRQSP